VADLPTLWAARRPATGRRRLLRTLLGDVTITPSTQDSTSLTIGLRWESGATQQKQVTRGKSAVQLRNTDPAAITLTRRIGPSLDEVQTAAPPPATGPGNGWDT
jgi:hypothetical protein